MSNFEALAKALDGAIGKNDEHQEVSVWLNTGFPPLNAAISGDWGKGWPSTRIVEIFGPESSGKTWLATQAMISAQKAGGVAAFNDHERSFQVGLAKKLGLDTTPGAWIFKTPKTYEDSVVLAINGCRAIRAAKVIKKTAPIVWVFDSLPSMIPQQMIAKDATALNMNDTTALARLTSKTFPALAQIAEECNALFIFLNQIRMKPGVVYGDPTTTPGGNAPKYYASVRVQLGATKLTKGDGDDQVMIGQQVTARIIKNKVNRPFAKVSWRFIFGEDGAGRFDVTGSLLDFAIKKKLLEKSGNYFVWEGGKYYRDALAAKIEKDGSLAKLTALISSAGVEVEEEIVETEEEDCAA